MAKTLDELKAENAALEAAQAETQVAEVENDETETHYEGDEVEAKETKTEGEVSAAPEAWMAEDSEDEQASGGGAKFSDGDIAAAKRKLRAKLEKQHNEELERVKAELEALKRNVTQPAVQSTATVPTLEQCDYDEGKYAAAMTAWVRSQVQGATQASEAQAQQAQQIKALEENVEAHYKRAAELVTKHNIDPDLYRSADENFRKTVERVFPGKGELIADQIIGRLSKLGPGSEKVAFQLGRSAQKREMLEVKLRQDPSGLEASMWLGTLLPEVNLPAAKKTRAPAPAARANGGQGVVSDEVNLRKKYQAENDVQKRFDIKMQAKRNGLDVKDW